MSARKNINIARANKNPTKAAKRFGPLSTGLLAIENFLIKKTLLLFSKLYFPRLPALNKKSAIKKAGMIT
jgi:hypothetical protein